MENIKIIFDLCYEILSIEINLFGYNVSLLNVLAYSIAGAILLFLLYRIFE